MTDVQTMTLGDLTRRLAAIVERSPSAADRPVYLLIDPPDDDDDINAETLYAPVTHASSVHDRLWWQDEPEFMVQLQGQVPDDRTD